MALGANGADDAQTTPRKLFFRQRRHKKPLVLAHWHIFPISYDNLPSAVDFYTSAYLSPNGEQGKHFSYGGFIRDRPLPRAPISSPLWQLVDAQSDIKLAQDAGVTGFQFNIPSLTAGGYLGRLNTYMRAVEQNNMEFAIAPCLDCASISNTTPPETIAGVVGSFLKRQAALKLDDGRPMLSAFCAERWDPAYWRTILESMKANGIDVYFAPMFLATNRATPEYLSMADMVGCWTGNHEDGVTAVRNFVEAARKIGKATMFSVWPQDCRPKAGWFAEAMNSGIFRKGWESAIDFKPECVNILTWNDYSECSQLRPSVGTQTSFADLNRYYVEWLSLGEQPPIERDALIYFHRRDFSDASHALSADRQNLTMKLQFGHRRLDDVEVLAYLTAPGVVEIENGAGIVRVAANAGATELRAPLAPGTQRFRLIRDGKNLVEIESPIVVRKEWDWQDLSYKGGDWIAT